MTNKTLPQNLKTWEEMWFWEEHYLTNEQTGCWEWQGKRNGQSKKYGRVSFPSDKRIFLAHRVAYFLYYRVDPGELLVRHLCHNTKCGNPEHLTLGTHEDNSRDMVESGRSQTGEKHWTARKPELMKSYWESGRYKKARQRLIDMNGESHPCTVLTADKVRDIRRRSANGEGNRPLAAEFGVTHANISAIVLGKSWQHVD